MVKKKTQQEFDGMPERDALGKAAINYHEKSLALKAAQEEKDVAKGLLVEAFKEDQKKLKRSSLSVDGWTYNYSHSEVDTVTAKKANEG
jgi:hypothetical protein